MIVSQYNKEDLGRLLGMPPGFATGLQWQCHSLSTYDWDGTTEDILAADNTGGSQAAGTSINNSWEAVIENGTSGVDGNHNIAWENRDDASWLANGKGPTSIKLNTTTGRTGGRTTIQTKAKVKYPLVGNNGVTAMLMIARNVNQTASTTAECYIGIGNYTQTSPFNGAPNIRAGSGAITLLGSSNTLVANYDASNTRTYWYDENVTNANFPLDRKNGDTLGYGVWRAPANASQSATDWKWIGAGSHNGVVWAFSESEISGKSVDVETTMGISGAKSFGGFITFQGTQSSKSTSFESLELWVAY